MDQGDACGQAVAGFEQVSHDLGRKRRKRHQPTQKTGDQQQPPDRIDLRHGLKHRNRHADQVAAQQIGRQRSPRG